MTRTLHERLRALACAALALPLAVALTPAVAHADTSSTILTLGADLTEDQQQTVLDFFNLTDEDLEDMQVITVTNSDEREYLEGTLSDSVIGYVTLSCSYIQITDSGGIDVETANLTYVTANTIYNALQTAGIENCNVVVTAPYEVSGTGALTGIFMAFEADGTTLDEDKKETATEELVTTAELEDEYGTEVAEVISDVKDEAVSSGGDLSTDEIATLVEDAAADHGITLSDEDLATVTDLIDSIQQLDYDANAFSDTLSSLNDNAEGILAAITSFFQSIADFFSNLISGITGSDDGSILDDLDTSVFDLDDAGSSGSSADTTSDTAEEATEATITEETAVEVATEEETAEEDATSDASDEATEAGEEASAEETSTDEEQ